MLEREFKFYLKNREKFLKDYEGKYLVIKGQKIIGAFESEIEAYVESQKIHELGTFLIQPCTADESSFKQTFNTRVTFK